jgi:uncharacterized protein (DUF736 family)
MSDRQQNPDELGALWEKSGGRGPYMTGTINGVKVVLFKNDRKSSDKSPDWRVLKAKSREDRPSEDSDPPF